MNDIAPNDTNNQVREMLNYLANESEHMTIWEKKFIAGLRPLPYKLIRGAKLTKVQEIFVETAERKRKGFRPKR